MSNSELQIETGVPIPPRHYGKGGGKYPFANMTVGQSFLVKCLPKRRAQYQSHLCVSAKSNGFKVTTRQTEEGVRCWLVGSKATNGAHA